MHFTAPRDWASHSVGPLDHTLSPPTSLPGCKLLRLWHALWRDFLLGVRTCAPLARASARAPLFSGSRSGAARALALRRGRVYMRRPGAAGARVSARLFWLLSISLLCGASGDGQAARVRASRPKLGGSGAL